MDGKTVAISQPGYLPYPGFFEKIARSDLFVFLDNVQYERRGWDNRNRIKTPQGPKWLTVPVKSKGKYLAKLAEIEIDNQQNWIRKHLNSITINYKRAEFFAEVYPVIEAHLLEGHKLLIDLNISLITHFCKYLGLETVFKKASELEAQGKGSDLILDILLKTGAATYFSGIFGKEYLQEEKFKEKGIDIVYQNYSSSVYPQLFGSFIPNLSIIDLLFNCGRGSREYI